MVKHGYKQTEIGVIPEDWEVKELDELTLSKGLIRGPFGGALKKEVFVPKGYKVYEQKNAIYKSVKLGNYFINKDKFDELKRFEVKSDDFILSCSGTIGKIYRLPENIVPGIINQALLIIRLNEEYINLSYFEHIFNDDKIQNKIIDDTQGGAMKNLVGMSEFKKTKFPLPPLAEQEAIAAALSDADAWIESLEQLIAKKRLIKQGAMQTLLTPKEDWKSKTLIEIADKKRDLFNDGDWIESEHIIDEGIRLVQTGNIGIGRFLNKGNRKYISEKSFNELKCKELREGDLLICRLAEPAGRACIFPKTEDYKSVTSVDVTIFRPDAQKYNREFLMYIFCTNNWFTDIIEKVGGTTHKRISRGNLGNITIKFPTLSEQERIATILSDMDAELEALETQLGKARQIKQGMMQKLLTGRTRLM